MPWNYILGTCQPEKCWLRSSKRAAKMVRPCTCLPKAFRSPLIISFSRKPLPGCFRRRMITMRRPKLCSTVACLPLRRTLKPMSSWALSTSAWMNPFSRLSLIATCWLSGRRQELSGLVLAAPWRGSACRRKLSSVIKEL